MLPAPARLRRRVDFAATVRRGQRGRSGPLLVHLVSTHGASCASPRCGFVVSKAVGGSVVRHRVLRRLRHLMTERLDRLPPGSQVVVRASPPAATASSAVLGAALDHSLRSVLSRAEGSARLERSRRT